MTRQTMVQKAQEAVKRQLLEGREAQFFRGWGERIVTADAGELLMKLAEIVAGLSCGIIVECTGGPAPHWDGEEWDAELTIFENPALNRPGDGKTCDAVLDAVLRCFADGGAFWPVDVRQLPGEERVGWVVRGKVSVAMVEREAGGGEC